MPVTEPEPETTGEAVRPRTIARSSCEAELGLGARLCGEAYGGSLHPFGPVAIVVDGEQPRIT